MTDIYQNSNSEKKRTDSIRESDMIRNKESCQVYRADSLILTFMTTEIINALDFSQLQRRRSQINRFDIFVSNPLFSIYWVEWTFFRFF